MSNFFDGMENTQEPLIVRSNNAAVADSKPTFPCQSCNGTGNYRGQSRFGATCFACKGKGLFAKPYADVMREKHNRKIGQVNALATRQAAFEEQNPGLRAWLANQQWSEFLVSIYNQLSDRGSLSENQLAAVLRSKAKCEANKAAKVAARIAAATVVNLAPIEEMFAKAAAKALTLKGATGKKLSYRAKGLVITPAKASSHNSGALYVKTTGGTYLGKVVNSKFMCVSEATDEHKETLNLIAANPSKVARDYGKETGTCSCCGRMLTDPISIEQGIGPICAEGWGF